MASYAQLQDRLQYLRDEEGVESLQGYAVNKSKAELEAKLAEVEAGLAAASESENVAIADVSEQPDEQFVSCPVCNHPMHLENKWLKCTSCPHKEYCRELTEFGV